LIEKLRDFFMTCPFLEPSEYGFALIGVDYLKAESVAYSLESMGGVVWFQQFQGTQKGIKQLNFAFSSMQPFSSEVLTAIENLQFFDNLNDWVQSQKLPKPLIDIEFTRPQIDFVSEGEDKAQYKIIGTLKYSVF